MEHGEISAKRQPALIAMPKRGLFVASPFLIIAELTSEWDHGSNVKGES